MQNSSRITVALLVSGGCWAWGRPEDAPAPTPAVLQAGDQDFAWTCAGQEWTARAYLPEGPAPQQGWPLVVALHGASGSGEHMLRANGWIELAELHGIALIAPDGQPARAQLAAHVLRNPRLWNSGQLLPRSERARIDDVAALEQMLDELARCASLDPARIFLTGHSNGAAMALRWTAERPTRFAALAVVAGQCAFVPSELDPAPPTLALHGELDPLQPAAGGRIELPWGSAYFPGTAQTQERWCQALGVDPQPEQLEGPGGSTITRWSGTAGQRFDWIEIPGHGHGWPGAEASWLTPRDLGPREARFAATPLFWEFFQEASQ